jgi:hypothetical protein
MSSGDGSAMICHAWWDGAAKLSMPAAPASSAEKKICALPIPASYQVTSGHIDEPNQILRELTDVQKKPAIQRASCFLFSFCHE